MDLHGRAGGRGGELNGEGGMDGRVILVQEE